MIEREIGGVPYFASARIYPNGRQAERIFLWVQKMSKKQKGKLDLGVYRLIPGGVGEARVIALVSLKRSSVEGCEKVIGGSETEVVKPHEFDALMARRVQVVAPIYASGEAKEGGQVLIRRPEKRGGRLRSDGTIEEQVGRDE